MPRCGYNHCESPAMVASATPSGKSQFTGSLCFSRLTHDTLYLTMVDIINMCSMGQGKGER